MIHLPCTGPRSDADDHQPGALGREVHHVHVRTVGHLNGEASTPFGIGPSQLGGERIGVGVVLIPGERVGAKKRRCVGLCSRVFGDDLGQRHAAVATSV